MQRERDRASTAESAARKEPSRSDPVSHEDIPAPSALLQPADVLALQRSVGNQAVLRRLNGPSTKQSSAQVLQRAETGLKDEKRSSAFATGAVDFWKAAGNKDKPLKDYANDLVTKANASLKALASREVLSAVTTTGSASGTFSRVTWTITINTTLFSNRAGVTKVGELTLDEAAEIADTIYHEIRHSEQYFRMARIKAAQSSKKDAGEIAAEIAKAMDIPPEVAQAAAAAPLQATKENAGLIAEAKDWESITIGIHATYKGVINQWGNEADEARDLAKAVSAANLDATKTKVGAHITKWKNDALRSKFVESHLTTVEAIKDKSHMDDLVLAHLKAIKADLVKVNAAWKDVEDNWGTDDAAKKLAHLKGPQAPLKELAANLYKAYRDHLHEKDAWETGAAVGKEFRKQGGKK